MPCVQAAAAVAEDRVTLARMPPVFPHRYVAHANLAMSLYSSYRCSADPADLTAAVEQQRAAIGWLPPGHPECDTAEHNLVMMLSSAEDSAPDAATVVALRRKVDKSPPDDPERPAVLAQLAALLYDAFITDGRPSVLHEAVDLLTEAIRGMRPDDPQRSVAEINLASVLLSRYGHAGGEEADLRRALETYERLAADPGAPRPPGFWPMLRHHLAITYQQLSEITGDPSLLDRAHALQGDDPAEPDQAMRRTLQSNVLDVLASQELFRYSRTGSLRDLDRAIDAQERAAADPVPGRARRAALRVNLGHCYLTRYESLRSVSRDRAAGFLDRAIDAGRQALADSPGALHRSQAQGLLGAAFFSRFVADDQRRPEDIEEAVDLLRAAVAQPTMAAGNRAGLLDRLAQCLAIRGALSGRLDDIDDGIAILQRLQAGTDRASTLFIRISTALADVLAVRAARTRTAVDVSRALAAAREAYRTADGVNARASLDAALLWGQTAWEFRRMPEAGRAYGLLVRQAHLLTGAQVLREDKYEVIRHLGDAAARAAYALAESDPAEAAMALETSRALLLTEAVERDRLDLDNLAADGHADVVTAYRAAATEVAERERNELRLSPRLVAPPVAGGAYAPDIAAAEAARARLRAAADRIRRLPGLATFQAAPDVAQLRAIAGEHSDPVVYLAATDHGGVALVMRPGQATPVPVPLPRLTRAEEHRLAELAGAAVRGCNAMALMRCLERAWDVAMGPIVEELGNARGVALVPTGRLGLLPLHAAAYRDAGRPGGWTYALDRIVVTYTPNARSLSLARRLARRAGRGTSVLAVSDPLPAPAGLPPLPMADVETARVVRQFPGRGTRLPGRSATPVAVRDAMRSADVSHFACHARNDPAAFLDSGLELSGGRLTLRDLLTADLSHTRLAVLSACDTAGADPAAPDEVIGLPGGLLQAGVGGVVATMWQVFDTAAMALMTRFYELWRAGGQPPAEALRAAQLWLRDATNAELHAHFPEVGALQPPTRRDPSWASDRDFSGALSWAPFAYYGA
jgi:CHAT domain-containing protein